MPVNVLLNFTSRGTLATLFATGWAGKTAVAETASKNAQTEL
jgi:hypothetical protein